MRDSLSVIIPHLRPADILMAFGFRAKPRVCYITSVGIDYLASHFANGRDDHQVGGAYHVH
jgi:hypothetical protein